MLNIFYTTTRQKVVLNWTKDNHFKYAVEEKIPPYSALPQEVKMQTCFMVNFYYIHKKYNMTK